MPPAPQALAASAKWRRTGALLCALVVVGALPSLPRGVLNWDNAVKLQVAANLARGEGLVLTEATPDDAQYVLVGKDGRRYASYPPLASALHLLTLAAERPLGGRREGVPALVLLGLTAWALLAWGRRAGVTLPAALAGALLATLGTSLWPMAGFGYDVLAEALALALVLRAATGVVEWRPWLLAGLALGGAMATRVGALSLGAAALAALLTQQGGSVRDRLRNAAGLAGGASPGIALIAWHNHYRFGSPFSFFQTTVLGEAGELLHPWFSPHHLEGMAGLVLSPGKGALWYAPPLLGALALAAHLWRHHRAAAAALAAQAAFSVVVFGRFRYWHGDWAWGPRYLAPLMIAAAPVGWWCWTRASLATHRRAAAAAGTAGFMVLTAWQVAPLVGRPVVEHFARTLLPLERAGLLATRPITRPPVQEDYRILYFEPANSAFASLGAALRSWAAEPKHRPRLAMTLARATLLPLLGLAFLLAVERAARRAHAGPMTDALAGALEEARRT